MATSLNPAGERFAASLVAQGKVNRTASWSWSASDEDSLLGKDGDQWDELGKHFLATESGTDPKTKQHWKYPFAKGDTLYRSALTAIRQRAGQQNATAIFEAAGRLLAAVDKVAQKAAAQVTLQFAATPIAPQTPDQPTGVQGVCYSGGIIPGYGGLGDCIIDLEDVQFAPSVFLLVNHSVDQRAGRASLAVVNNQLLLTGQFSRVTPAGQQVAAEFAEGAPFDFSVGIQAELEFSPTDKLLRTINGQEVAVNAIFAKPRVLEVSLVPAGADPHTAAAAFSAVTDSLFSPREAKMTTPSVDVSEQDRPAADTQLLSELARLTAENKALGEQVAELARLTAENKALSEQVSALRQQMTAARTKDVDALFSELGQTPQPAERQSFIDMSVEAFSTVATMLRETHKSQAFAAHLFSAQTEGEGAFTPGKGKIPSPAEIFEQRRKAAAKARAGQ